MKFITNLKCIAVVAMASAFLGFSVERSEAASLATVVYTVDSGVVTHISITNPFVFRPNSGGTYGNITMMIGDLYPGAISMAQDIAPATPDLLFYVAGSSVSYNGEMTMTGAFVGGTADGDMALVFSFPGGINLTSEDYVDIHGGFAVNPASNVLAPTAGMYSATLYQIGGGSPAPLSNTLSVQVIVNSVPEPGSCLLGLLGTVLMMVRRKR